MELVLIAAGVVVAGVIVTLLVRRHRRRREVRTGMELAIDATLQATAELLGAEYELPEPGRGGSGARFGSVRGRMRGCVYALTVVENTEPPPDKEGLFSHPPFLATVRVLHFGADETVVLRGLGLEPPDLDPNRLQRAVADTCAARSGR